MAKEQKAASMFGGTTINVHLANADALQKIQTSLDTILKNQVKLMADASKLQSDLDGLVAAVATAITAIVSLEAKIDALSAGQITQEQIDALDAEVTTAKDALTAGTPTT